MNIYLAIFIFFIYYYLTVIILFINHQTLFFLINNNLNSVAIFNLSSLEWTKLILSNRNSLQITFFPNYLLNNLTIILSIQCQFYSQRIKIINSINFIKFPFTDLYTISLSIDGNKVNSFKINVTTQNQNFPDSFFDCKNISNSLRCQISNVCLSSKGLSFFGYGDNVQINKLPFIIDPMKQPEMLNIISENNFDEHYSFEDIPAIFTDLQSCYTSFFHLITETLFPFTHFFTENNLLNSSKTIILKRKPISILQYFPILNANVSFLNENKCFKKLFIGFPKYNGYYDPRFLHFLDPDLYNYQYRKTWRLMHEKYFARNENNKKINLLLLNRPISCHRSIINYDQIISAIKSEYPNWNVVYSEFTNVSIYKQIQMILNTDILLTIHGAAEVHMLLLKDNALVIEIMPYLLDTFLHLYENLANITQLRYLEFHASKKSSFPRKNRLISEYEKNPKTVCNGVFRSNIRNQNVILNETEIDLLLKLIKNNI